MYPFFSHESRYKGWCKAELITAANSPESPLPPAPLPLPPPPPPPPLPLPPSAASGPARRPFRRSRTCSSPAKACTGAPGGSPDSAGMAAFKAAKAPSAPARASACASARSGPFFWSASKTSCSVCYSSTRERYVDTHGDGKMRQAGKQSTTKSRRGDVSANHKRLAFFTSASIIACCCSVSSAGFARPLPEALQVDKRAQLLSVSASRVC